MVFSNKPLLATFPFVHSIFNRLLILIALFDHFHIRNARLHLSINLFLSVRLSPIETHNKIEMNEECLIFIILMRMHEFLLLMLLLFIEFTLGNAIFLLVDAKYFCGASLALRSTYLYVGRHVCNVKYTMYYKICISARITGSFGGE